MKIKFKINQKSAFLAGIDTASDSVEIDIDPATLTQAQRAYLAEKLVSRDDGWYVGLELLAATSTHVVTVIDAAIADAEEQKKRGEIEYADAVAQMISRYGTAPIEDLLQIRDNGSATLKTVSQAAWDLKLGSKRARFQTESTLAALVGRENDANARIAQIDAEATAVRLAELAAIAELEAAKKSAYDALYARLPDTLRARDADGYAQTDEIIAALRTMILSDAGYPTVQDWDDHSSIQTLSDDEYLQLGEIKRTAPKNAIVMPALIWSDFRGYRHAEPDDSDGEIWPAHVEEGQNVRRAAVIKWTHAGIEVMTAVPLQ